MTLAYLSSPHGQEVQEEAYAELTRAYEGEDPWVMCLQEEKSEYMVSFVKVTCRILQLSCHQDPNRSSQEVLRYWSTINMSFTRESVKDIEYHGAVIPANTPFYMVCTPPSLLPPGTPADKSE